jgi:type II restriction enzyme
MSEGLSERTKKFNQEGKHFTDDSRHSEKVLKSALDGDVKAFTDDYILTNFPPGCSLVIQSKMSISQIKLYQRAVYPDCPETTPQDESTWINPDGNIWFLKTPEGKLLCIGIFEDKKQGTNDTLCCEGKKKQGCGNAIERYAKNVRASEMIFSDESIFPYVLYGSGCDFHSSESIPNRISSSNYGFPNHYLDVCPGKTDDSFKEELDSILSSVNIGKKLGGNACVVQAFIKAHKFDVMPHGASNWKKEEIAKISCHILKESLDYYRNKYFTS